MKPLFAAVCFMLAARAATATVIPVTDDSIPAGTTVTWTAGNTYLLTGFVFVKPGSRLNIEPGTLVWAKEGNGSNASALIVCRDGRIYARGTADKPIIFTAEYDDPANPGELGYDPASMKGLWGGLLICGRAPNNVNGQVNQTEGVPAEFGDRIKYGDSSNALDQSAGKPIDSAARARNTYDTSGVLRYVSIRRPGSVLAAGKEINGLTLCSVGRGTIIDHVEVFNSADDGIEWFGGTVDCKYIVCAFADDDSYDYDQGYSGRCQFLFAIQNMDFERANRLGEFDSDDGAEVPSNAGSKPYAAAVWYNCTFIGSGKANPNPTCDFALIYKENAGGIVANSILGDVVKAAVSIEDKAGTEVDAYGRFVNGDIQLRNNIFFNPGVEGVCSPLDTRLRDSLRVWHNIEADPKFGGISRETQVPDGKLDPRPLSGSPALADTNVGAIPSGSDFFVQTKHVGAFDQTDNWMRGWTLLYQAGFLNNTIGIDPKQQKAVSGMVPRLDAVMKGDGIAVRYVLPRAGWTSLTLYGLDGARIATSPIGQMGAGVHTANIPAASLGTSMYLLRLMTGSHSVVQKVVVGR